MIATENLKGRSGVYCAIHRDSLKCYVGGSRDMHRRRNAHIADARRGSHSNFHRALREFGVGSFDFEVLEFCGIPQVKERETFWIKFYECAGLKGFNTQPDENGSKYGEMTEATRQRMCAAQQNRPPISEETRKKISETLKGMPSVRIGMKHSPEAIEKLKIARRIRGSWPMTEEGKRKISLANKGRKLTPEQVEKLKAAKKGKPIPWATEAARKANTGRIFSEAHRAALRANHWKKKNKSL